LKRGDGVAHGFNCIPAFVDLRLAEALVKSLSSVEGTTILVYDDVIMT